MLEFTALQVFFMWMLAFTGTSLAASVKIVRQGDEALIELLGKYDGKKLEPGLTFVIPFFEQVAYKGTLKEQIFSLPPIQCITSERKFVTLNIAIYWRILDLEKASYKVQNLHVALMTLLYNQIRSEIVKIKVEDLYTIRERFNEAMLLALDVATEPWGLKITRVELLDFNVDNQKKNAPIQSKNNALILTDGSASLAGYLHSNSVNLNTK
jgi:regulator of protease activity HflC (stomatin/prohibitin superfamily)